MAATIISLLVLCIVLTALTSLQGPKLDRAQVDTGAVTTTSDQQLRIFANQVVAEVDPEQVSVQPAADFTVTTSDDTIAVQFSEALAYDTRYTVEVDDVTSAYSDRASTFRHQFMTDSATVHYLDRVGPEDDTGSQDAIMSASLRGVGSSVVFEAPAIQDFVVSGDILVVATLNDDDTSSMTLIDTRDGGQEQLALPDSGTVDLLRADIAGTVGFTFTTTAASAQGLAGVLHTFDLNGSHTPRPILGLDGEPLAALNWYLIGETGEAVVQAADLSTSIVDATGETPPIPRGQFNELVSISPRSDRVVVSDAQSLIELDLDDGTQERLAVAPIDGVRPFVGQAVLLGGGAFVAQVVVLDEESGRFASSVVYDDGASSRVLYENPGNNGSIGLFTVSPNGQYVAVEATPGGADLAIDGYVVNPRLTGVTTVIVEVGTGSIVRTLDGFAPTW